ncbi:MAG: TCR/Tet family MFS transporter [Alphaproteobacteria bacterium]|nr:TCR/Tet family MFS transporter [Alphaproteobacteria bacterium]
MTARQPGRFAVAFVFITVFLDMVGIGLIWPVLPRLIEDVSATDLAGASVWNGWLFVAYGLTQFLFGPMIGNLSDAFGRRPVLLISVFGLGIDYVLMAFAPTIAWLFAGRLISGLCGASYTTANAYLADVAKPEERARVFGMMGAAFGLGFIVGPAIGGLLGEVGVRVPFVVAAGLSILNFVYGYFVLPETLSRNHRRPFSIRRSNPLETLRVFRSYRGVVPLGIVTFGYFTATSVYPAIWSFWGIARFGWSEATIGLTLAAFGLVMAITQGLLTGPTVRWLGERKTVFFALITAIVSAAGYTLAPGLTAVLLLFIIHAPEGFLQPSLTALMSKEAPANAQGELQGGIASLQSIASLIGTFFFAQAFGWFMAPNPIIITPSAGFFICMVLLIATFAYFVSLKDSAAVTPR